MQAGLSLLVLMATGGVARANDPLPSADIGRAVSIRSSPLGEAGAASLLHIPWGRAPDAGQAWAGFGAAISTGAPSDSEHRRIGASGAFAGVQLSDRVSVGFIARPDAPTGLDLGITLLEEDRWTPNLRIGAQALGSGEDRRYVALNRRLWTIDLGVGLAGGQDGAGPFGGLVWRFHDAAGLSLAADRRRAAIGLELFAADPVRFTASIDDRGRVGLRFAIIGDPGTAFGAHRRSADPPDPARASDPVQIAPVGDRPFGDRPLGDRPLGDRPLGGRPLGGRPVAWAIADALADGGHDVRAVDVTGRRATAWIVPSGPGASGRGVSDWGASGRATVDAEAIGHAFRTLHAILPPPAGGVPHDAAPAVERLAVVLPGRSGLSGLGVEVDRQDVANGSEGRGSPEELWRRAVIVPAAARPPPIGIDSADHGLALRLGLTIDPQGPFAGSTAWRVTADAKSRASFLFGADALATLRLNLADRLDEGRGSLVLPDDPVRSDTILYARASRASIPVAALSWQHSLTDALHAGLTLGALEEAYTGYAGQLLYRPFTARWAVGGDAALVWKRAPGRLVDVIEGSRTLTGHLAFMHDRVDGTRFEAMAGRFLGGDWGIETSLARRWRQGLWGRLATSVAAGQGRGVSAMVRLRLEGPFPGGGWLGRRLGASILAGDVYSDRGQRLEHPDPLADALDRTGYGGLVGSWHRVFD